MTTEPRVDYEFDESSHETAPYLHVVGREDAASQVSEETPRSELYARIGTVSSRPNVAKPDIIIHSDDTLVLRNGEILLSDDRLFVFNALLKNIGKPLRAEELRREGFEDRDNVTHTRDAFKSIMYKLKQDTDAISNSEIILKQGVTKGTRYHIPESVKIVDRRRPEIKDISEYVRRNRIVNELCAQFHDHPYVLERLQQYENPDFKPPRMGQDEVGTYTALLRKYRLLTALEEVELFTDIDNGLIAYDSGNIGSEEEPSAEILDLVAARQITFNTNTRLAFNLAMKKWRFKGTMSEMDVVHEANFGLSQAIARMDVSKGYKFSTYATHWINQAITRALANQSREIRLPVHLHEKFIKVSGILHKKASELDRPLTEAEITEYTGMSIEDYNDLMTHGKLHLVSLNKYVDDTRETELGDLLPLKENSENQAVNTIESHETLSRIIEASNLTDTEKFIVALRYGIGNAFPEKLSVRHRFGTMLETSDLLEHSSGIEMKLVDIGELLGLSAERIRQIEGYSLKKLQKVAD